MFVYWNEDFVAASQAPDALTKSRDIVQRLHTDPIPNVEIVDPMADFEADGRQWISSFDEAALEHILHVHSQDYVEAVRTGTPASLAESSSIPWTPDIFKMAISHTTGLCAAVSHALEFGTQAGSLSPNMNHARAASGNRLCTFNGLAAAVSFALRGWNLEKVLVLDLDADFAGGTDEILSRHFGEKVIHIDCSTSGSDQYAVREGNYTKSPISQAYEPVTEMLVQRVFSNHTFDLVIYNAGMNPIDSGVSAADLASREKMVRWYIGNTPAVFALGGGKTSNGFSMNRLVDLHLHTLREWSKYEGVVL